MGLQFSSETTMENEPVIEPNENILTNSPYFLRPMKKYGNCEYHLTKGNRKRSTWNNWEKNSSFYQNITPIPKSVLIRNTDKDGNIYNIVSNELNLSRIFPLDGKHNIDNYILLFCLEKHVLNPDGTTILYLKGAVKHRVLDQIVLLNGTNFNPNEKLFNSVSEGWYSYKCSMVAPPLFWDILNLNVLILSELNNISLSISAP